MDCHPLRTSVSARAVRLMALPKILPFARSNGSGHSSLLAAQNRHTVLFVQHGRPFVRRLSTVPSNLCVDIYPVLPSMFFFRALVDPLPPPPP